RWYRKAAEQGLPQAQVMLGLFYEWGAGVLASRSAALEWYSSAGGSYLEEGDREGALTCYDSMRELDPDHDLTLKLFAELYPRDVRDDGSAAGQQTAAEVPSPEPVTPPVEAVAPPGRLSPYHWLLIGGGVVLLVVAAGAALARRKAAGG
ncbi:MAG: sel1 repeat family protein, partial [Candidatus Brocadiae bacterium]|nr:sel1 repeat family protein [Candidatus Brocadiia bacterium]